MFNFLKKLFQSDGAKYIYEKFELMELIQSKAKSHKLDWELIASIIYIESGGNQFAYRYEHNFYKKYLLDKNTKTIGGYIDRKVSFESEKRARAFSYGLMQIMGQTAREFGLTGNLMQKLFNPVVNLEYGCRILNRKLEIYGKGKNPMHNALLYYNGGGNKEYPDLVFKVKESLAYEKIFFNEDINFYNFYSS